MVLCLLRQIYTFTATFIWHSLEAKPNIFECHERLSTWLLRNDSTLTITLRDKLLLSTKRFDPYITSITPLARIKTRPQFSFYGFLRNIIRAHFAKLSGEKLYQNIILFLIFLISLLHNLLTGQRWVQMGSFTEGTGLRKDTRIHRALHGVADMLKPSKSAHTTVYVDPYTML